MKDCRAEKNGVECGCYAARKAFILYNLSDDAVDGFALGGADTAGIDS